MTFLSTSSVAPVLSFAFSPPVFPPSAVPLPPSRPLTHHRATLPLAASTNGSHVVIRPPRARRAFESSTGPSALPAATLAAAKSGAVAEADLTLLEGEWVSGS